MELYLKITAGTRAGDTFKLQSGISLGRSKADINLKDTKASSMHGRIAEEEGSLFYLDLNSTNGTVVNGQSIKKIKLTPGMKLTIGATVLEVVSEFDVKKTAEVNMAEWRESLFNFLQGLKIDQKPHAVAPFEKCVSVEVKSGSQAGASWILGYGPRKMGPMSSDLCLIDDSLDDFCLEISQTEEGHILLESIGEEPFIINGQKRNTEILKNRIKVQIGNTLLELGFVE